MQLTEVSVIDKIEIMEMGQIQIRRADKIYRDNVEISKSYHRHVIVPGDDISNEDSRVQEIASTVWTPEVIAACQEHNSQTL